MDIKNMVKEIEEFMGLTLEREEVEWESQKPHNELFSYHLCQRFWNRGNDLESAIKEAKRILGIALKGSDRKLSGRLFSLIGNMLYVKGDYKGSSGYFMKALEYNRLDITNWVEFMFSLRAMGEFGVFEDLMFNLEKVYNRWKNDDSETLNQRKVYELLDMSKSRRIS